MKTLATLAEGIAIANPHHLKWLKCCHRAVTRTQKGSKHRREAACRQAQRSRTIAQQWANTLQQGTTRLAHTKAVIVLEGLQVAGARKPHLLAHANSDVGFAECRRPLAYQVDGCGAPVVLAARGVPASKTCAGCGWVDAQLTPADRTFRCRTSQGGVWAGAGA